MDQQRGRQSHQLQRPTPVQGRASFTVGTEKQQSMRAAAQDWLEQDDPLFFRVRREGHGAVAQMISKKVTEM